MLRRVCLPWIMLSLLGVLVLVAACGDDDNGDGNGSDNGNGSGAVLDLETYMDAVDFAQTAYSNRNAEAEELYPGVNEEVAATSDAYAYLADSSSQFANDLDALNPPDNADALNTDAVDALNDLADVQNRVSDEVGDAADASEMGDILDGISADYDAAFAAVTNACEALQVLADEEGIVVDLDCPGS